MIGGNANGKHQYNTYDNLIGTIKELIEYFNKNIIRGRSLQLSKGMSILNQLIEIKESEDKQGIVVFFFPDDNPKSILLEKVYVFVR